MRTVIIEDEIQAAWDLQYIIKAVRPDLLVVAILDSVESATEWFSSEEHPDLIFSDISLGDGLSFEIFKRVKISCPIIFCTAYDQYAIQAFKNNGLDYLLKPVTNQDLEKSINKIELLKKQLSQSFDYDLFHRVIGEIQQQDRKFKNTFLVSYRDKYIPIEATDIRLFRISADCTQVFTADDKVYLLTQSLDAIEKQINPNIFYRANRQHIVSFKAIKEVQQDDERKLKVKLSLSATDHIIISKAKASHFLNWIERR